MHTTFIDNSRFMLSTLDVKNETETNSTVAKDSHGICDKRHFDSQT